MESAITTMDSLTELEKMLAELSPGNKTTGNRDKTTGDGAAAGLTSSKDGGISGHVAASNPSTIQSNPSLGAMKKRRSSISKTSGVNSAGSGEVNPGYVKSDNLDGIYIKRIPLAEPDFRNGEIRKLMEYTATNTRDKTVRLALEFQGTNFRIEPMGLASISGTTISLIIPAGFSGAIASAGPDNASNEYSFSMNIRVTPIDLKEEAEEDLQGVVLYRCVTHDDMTYVDFRVKNTRKFSIEAVIDVIGDYTNRGFVPKKVVKSGETVSFGGVSNIGDVNTSWHWKGLEPVDAQGNVVKPVNENDFTESELKGVFLGRVVFPAVDGNPGKVRFRVRNTRDEKINIDITVGGNIVGSSGKLSKEVGEGDMVIVGDVSVRGQMDIKWKWAAL